GRTIEGGDAIPQESIKAIFAAFEKVLGPVGAAKSLHLLIPRLFPLWDRAIAQAYGLPLGIGGTNSERYWKFMLIAKAQCESLRQEGEVCISYLKGIDEYNYCMYTQKWIKPKSTT